MIIAMVAMRMVKVAIHQVVHMISMRDLGMAAVISMHMVGLVTSAIVTGRAGVGIAAGYFYYTFIHMIAVDVVQFAVVQVIDVSIVFDSQMTTARTMLMFVPFDFVADRHNRVSFCKARQ